MQDLFSEIQKILSLEEKKFQMPIWKATKDFLDNENKKYRYTNETFQINKYVKNGKYDIVLFISGNYFYTKYLKLKDLFISNTNVEISSIVNEVSLINDELEIIERRQEELLQVKGKLIEKIIDME